MGVSRLKGEAVGTENFRIPEVCFLNAQDREANSNTSGNLQSRRETSANPSPR